MMTSKRKLSMVLSAAVSLALAGFASAQYRVGTDGRALDANNRVGSGGLNSGPAQPLPYGVNGNNIITGNITGGREFRGFVPYSDPREFRGSTAGGLSDRFIRQSSAAPFGGNVSNNAQVVQPFYGAARFTPPPAGTEQQSIGSGAYVPAPLAMRGPGDLRLGQVYDTPAVALPKPGVLFLPGPVDANGQANSLITASPLYGVRQADLKSAADQVFVNDYVLGNAITDPAKAAAVQKAREELSPQEDGQEKPDGNKVLKPLESPDNSALSGQSVTEKPVGSGTLGSDATSTGGVRQRLLVSPRKQSTQYDELAKRLAQYNAQVKLDNSAQQYNEQMRARKAAEEKAQGKQGATPAPGPTVKPPEVAVPSQTPPMLRPPTDTTPQPPTAQTPTPTVAPPPPSGGVAPLQIHSLAEGITAKGLSDILNEAETLMKAGKYGAALDQFEMAEQVAPNNPMILIGKANVELAQSYYTRADGHLRQAFTQNQELLMGQYDLRSWIGDDRLQYLVTELKATAKNETKDDKPLFLLAYIAYNTGNPKDAAGYLDLADKRAGGNNPFYQLVRKHWSLPAMNEHGNREDLNK